MIHSEITAPPLRAASGSAPRGESRTARIECRKGPELGPALNSGPRACFRVDPLFGPPFDPLADPLGGPPSDSPFDPLLGPLYHPPIDTLFDAMFDPMFDPRFYLQREK